MNRDNEVCLFAALAELEVLAAPILGLDVVSVGFRVGPLPQPS